MFEPSVNKSEGSKNTFTAGLTFPDLTLQAYRVSDMDTITDSPSLTSPILREKNFGPY